MKWDEWRGPRNGPPSMLIKRLFEWRGYRVDLHKFERADAPGCYHTHPASAIRIVLWGGYFEEVIDRSDPSSMTVAIREWKPFWAGKVAPDLCHRIAALRNGRSSWSLWLRGPKTASAEIVGAC